MILARTIRDLLTHEAELRNLAVNIQQYNESLTLPEGVLTDFVVSCDEVADRVGNLATDLTDFRRDLAKEA